MEGIVENITSGLVEGSRVKQGDVILELQPAVANLRSQLEGQLANLTEKLARTVEKTSAYEEQINELVDADEETSDYVRHLEQTYDDEDLLASGDLIDEVERFLRDQG